MLINPEFLLPHLQEKLRITTRDASRHILCPYCKRRSRLYRLKDGRRKCSDCGRKFKVKKQHEEQRLREIAVLLLCFCLDFTALKTVSITGLRYKVVSRTFAEFRTMLAHQAEVQELIGTQPKRWVESGECAQCRKLAKMEKESLIFAMKHVRGKVKVEQVNVHFSPHRGNVPIPGEEALVASEYQAFLCHGSFHRITPEARNPATEQLSAFWSWAEEQLRPYHGVIARNMWWYLKELEWKYNNRHLKPQMQAMRLLLMLPSDLLQQ